MHYSMPGMSADSEHGCVHYSMRGRMTAKRSDDDCAARQLTAAATYHGDGAGRRHRG